MTIHVLSMVCTPRVSAAVQRLLSAVVHSRSLHTSHQPPLAMWQCG